MELSINENDFMNDELNIKQGAKYNHLVRLYEVLFNKKIASILLKKYLKNN